MRKGWLCGVAASILFGASAHGQSFQQPGPGQTFQPPPRAPSQNAPAPNAPAPDPAMEAAQRAYEALPEFDRRAIQEALMWTGDYNVALGVNFGKRLYDGVRAWQKRRNAAQTGALDPQQRSDLYADAKRARDSVRFSTLDDPATKIRIGVPIRVTERKSPVNGAGFAAASYGSNDRALTLDLSSWPLSSKTLEQSYAEETANRPGRKITYKILRPDFYVVTGEEGGRSYYRRAAKNASDMRMFSFGYPAARRGDYERVMLAMANSFEPFPGTATAAATPAALQPAVPPPPRPVFAATGLVIAPGRVLTSAAVTRACANPTINGAPARAEGPGAGGAIILATQGGRAAGVAAGRASADEDNVVTISAAAGQPAQVSSGSLRASGDVALLAAGLSGGVMGAPVFDRTGALIGLVADAPKAVTVASLGAPPAMNHRVLAASGFASLLPASGAASSNLSAGAIAARIAPAIVAIGCGA